ncbi:MULTISPECIES: hypothetical protein [Streptomyces]|uniref:Uncharacterized protein n=1 Tax=Streptomyces lonegramiae TaxID=3075524 RepID=A0ABU2XD32_9ACTN|nr:hypothetical protein [Streptomyces sp. DSM 41529]MDT0543819.1 hypothetical protein [Streptomyces sp. DSM 41529]
MRQARQLGAAKAAPTHLPRRERQRQLQWKRRRLLLLALDGIDAGPKQIHGMRVGAAR